MTSAQLIQDQIHVTPTPSFARAPGLRFAVRPSVTVNWGNDTCISPVPTWLISGSSGPEQPKETGSSSLSTMVSQLNREYPVMSWCCRWCVEAADSTNLKSRMQRSLFVRTKVILDWFCPHRQQRHTHIPDSSSLYVESMYTGVASNISAIMCHNKHLNRFWDGNKRSLRFCMHGTTHSPFSIVLSCLRWKHILLQCMTTNPCQTTKGKLNRSATWKALLVISPEQKQILLNNSFCLLNAPSEIDYIFIACSLYNVILIPGSWRLCGHKTDCWYDSEEERQWSHRAMFWLRISLETEMSRRPVGWQTRELFHRFVLFSADGDPLNENNSELSWSPNVAFDVFEGGAGAVNSKTSWGFVNLPFGECACRVAFHTDVHVVSIWERHLPRKRAKCGFIICRHIDSSHCDHCLDYWNCLYVDQADVPSIVSMPFVQFLFIRAFLPTKIAETNEQVHFKCQWNKGHSVLFKRMLYEQRISEETDSSLS